jgi:hypothetical protein
MTALTGRMATLSQAPTTICWRAEGRTTLGGRRCAVPDPRSNSQRVHNHGHFPPSR